MEELDSQIVIKEGFSTPISGRISLFFYQNDQKTDKRRKVFGRNCFTNQESVKSLEIQLVNFQMNNSKKNTFEANK